MPNGLLAHPKLNTMKRLLQHGFEHTATNPNGTETFIVDGMTVKAYENGYVRRAEPNEACYQLNLTKKVYEDDYYYTQRILLPTRIERYERLINWITNVRRRDGRPLIGQIVTTKVKNSRSTLTIEKPSKLLSGEKGHRMKAISECSVKEMEYLIKHGSKCRVAGAIRRLVQMGLRKKGAPKRSKIERQMQAIADAQKGLTKSLADKGLITKQ